MKGKRGYVGRMLTTVDYLTGKEKREYTKARNYKVSNVYEELMKFNELITYPARVQKKILVSWRDKFKQKEILDGMGVNKNIYYKKLYDLDILEKPKHIKAVPENHSNKRGQVEAVKGDVLTNPEFNALPETERHYLLDYYFDRFTSDSIASLWGRKKSSIHQTRYLLKKHMKENGYVVKDEQKKKEIYDKYHNSTKKPIKTESVAIEEEKPAVQNLMQLYSEESNKIEDVQPDSSVSNGEPIPNNPEEPKEATEDNTEENKDLHKELETMKQELADMVKKRDEEIQKLQLEKEFLELSHKQELEKRDEAEKAKQDAVDKISFSTPRFTALENVKINKEPQKQHGMTFNYTDQKEGFLLHQDIKNFISMLEKNPSEFNVEMKIKRVEDA